MNRKTVFLQLIMVLTSGLLLRFKAARVAISRWRMELLRIFGSSSLLFLMKVTGGQVQIQGKKIQKVIRPLAILNKLGQ